MEPENNSEFNLLNDLMSSNPQFPTLSYEELLQHLSHLHNQFRNRYHYLVGYWQSSPRAKNTRNGQLVQLDDVFDFLNQDKK